MAINFLLETFKNNRSLPAVIDGDQTYTFQDLQNEIGRSDELLTKHAIPEGSVVILEADFSLKAIGILLALIKRNCIVVPLSQTVETKKQEFIEIAQGEYKIHDDGRDIGSIVPLHRRANHEHYNTLRMKKHPGLVLFSSGSSGKNKGAAHDFTGILEKFKAPRTRGRSICFLLFDHIGGINTLFHHLANAGCLITLRDRSPDAVLAAVERHRAELIPTSPTFLNLMLLSGAYERHDLSSLKVITYGTEPMPEMTLTRLKRALPHIKLLQTYGLSELGILHTKSKSSDSLWMKLGGEGFAVRVAEGVLQIKAHSAMLGYLNAPSPFTSDGWYDTGDLVETDGEYFRILGRASEIINVGGQKVSPTEVESVLMEADNVASAIVYGERNVIMGTIVCAQIRTVHPEDHRALTDRLKTFCQSRLKAYQVPVKIIASAKEQHTERYKKMRRAA